MIKANELRIGNVFNREIQSQRGVNYETEFVITTECLGKIFSNDLSISLNDLSPIPLTSERLKRAGFYQLPHKTIQNNWMIKLGRDRFISVACVGTPNEMVFITEEEAPDVKNIIVARNYDYNGKTYAHQLQNLYYDLTGEELVFYNITN